MSESAGREQRIDLLLVERGLAASRTEAQAAIKAGHVTAAGRRVLKSSETVDPAAEISFAPAHPYVSRGALKLIAALERFDLSPDGRVCLDLGASAGGFTQVLLERGAKRVYAVDVGHGQLHPKLARDARVVALEGLNARDLDTRRIPQAPQAIVADVSFISLKLVLPPALALAAPGAWLAILVKPQFEVGRGKLAKGGIVRDDAARAKAVAEIETWLGVQPGWSVAGTMESPITGGDGNREYLLAAAKT